MEKPLWQPSPEQIANSNITAFAKAQGLNDFAALYNWSITEPEKFWQAMWNYGGIIGNQGNLIVKDKDKIPGAQWFPQAEINFAENLLRRKDDATALVFWGEDKIKRRLSYKELYAAVSRAQQAFKAAGIKAGDRVAAFMPNMPETIIAMLGATSLGAIWSSASPDFGVQGVLDRFGQIGPKIMVAVEGYFYNGKAHDCLEKLEGIAKGIPSLEKLLVVSYTRDGADLSKIPQAVSWNAFLAPYSAGEVVFPRFAFNHPLYIMYSSGTTGVPKCIVHGAGGTLIQHLKEHKLHCDIKPGDRVFYFTTCGWMMWNWLVSGLAAEATLLLYDGSPFYPSGNIIFEYIAAEKGTMLGTSAKWIDSVKKAGLEPGRDYDLSSVRLMTSTGSPLSPEGFDYVYEKIKPDVCLSSISGGTDIISCFVLGNPCGPVYRGEIQTRGLGMKVEVFDEDGKAIIGDKGELVCTLSFPSMPVGFWNDEDGQKYHNAYFANYPNVWCHGDWVELTPRGGMIIYGRSDATLNPGGVRIGTAEIYRQVEQLPEVIESLVVGQDWDNDVRVVLFVRLKEGLALDEGLVKRIKDQIKVNCTPRHVPAKVIQVADIPRTKSGKIVELAVRNVVHGRAVKNVEALANPEALEYYRGLKELGV